MYLPISLKIPDGQGSGTSVVIARNEKAKSCNIENIQLNSNELQTS